MSVPIGIDIYLAASRVVKYPALVISTSEDNFILLSVIWNFVLGQRSDDECNLLYVAVTRAKKRLQLTRFLLNVLASKKVILSLALGGHGWHSW